MYLKFLYWKQIFSIEESEKALNDQIKKVKEAYYNKLISERQDDESVNRRFIILNTPWGVWRADLRLRKWSRRFRNLPFL